MSQSSGGGEGFRWEGYDDAWVDVGGLRIQSVPGGSHWGGGVSIGALYLIDGRSAAPRTIVVGGHRARHSPVDEKSKTRYNTWKEMR